MRALFRRRFAVSLFATAVFMLGLFHESSAQVNSVSSGRDTRGNTRYGVLIAGLDRDPQSSDRDRRTDAHTDTLVLLTSQTGSGVVDALHIPRDTRVLEPGIGFIKINGVYMNEGRQGLRRAASKLTGIHVNAVLLLDFFHFRQAVALAGSVPFAVDRPIWDPEGDVALPTGWRRLTPRQALAVVRFRHEPLGDIGRVHRQERFMRSAVAIAAHLPPAVFTKVMRTLDAQMSERETLLAYSLVHPLVLYRAHSIPGNFSTGPGASYWLPDQTGVQTITELVLGKSASVPAFAHWRNNAAIRDADDGRDRSR